MNDPRTPTRHPELVSESIGKFTVLYPCVIKLAALNTDARLSFLSHRWRLAAKWTLKRVQGDDLGNQTRYFTKIYVTLSLFQGLSNMGQPTARSTHD